jgi:RHH-type proline utilization regulon transcriptional repressor/proline dehydrogenase/delta 1-pyrroline-5-carboxylate dehydrogenase
LDKGESWLIEPKQLDDTGRLWRPGVKIGVTKNSFYHLNECFGPVLGLMKAKNLQHALELQNGTDFGLTAGIHSLNVDELQEWLGGIEAGNLYVNRGVTGAIVERQPFGGFKRSSVGWGLKAGGRNYLLQFGRFVETTATQFPNNELVSNDIKRYLANVAPFMNSVRETSWLEQAASSDARWHRELYARDQYGLQLARTEMNCEANYHRYLPQTSVIVRVSRPAQHADIARVVMAATIAGTDIQISFAKTFLTSNKLGSKDLELLTGGFKYSSTEEQDFNPTILPGTKLLLVGPREEKISELQENPDLFVVGTDITKSGRTTLLALMREQAISVTQHRFGAIQSELASILERVR